MGRWDVIGKVMGDKLLEDMSRPDPFSDENIMKERI